jgi:DNA-binding transcriptional LysR family regulator
MELRQVRYFVAVAEERHFGRAADRLHIAQPSLSQQIRQLEAELGVRLLSRTTRRVDLTAAGAVFLERGREILAATEAALDEVRRVEAGVEGRLTVGCVGSATYSLLPAFARTLREAMPQVDLTVRGEMLVPDQVAALRAGEIDLAILRPPIDDDRIVLDTVRRERLLVALPEGHPLAARSRLRISELAAEPLIAHPGRSVMRRVTVDLAAGAGFEPRIVQEVAETSTLVMFVAAGLGVALVPETVAALGIAGVVFRPLSGGPRLDLAAAHLSDHVNLPLLLRAVALLRDSRTS